MNVSRDVSRNGASGTELAYRALADFHRPTDHAVLAQEVRRLSRSGLTSRAGTTSCAPILTAAAWPRLLPQPRIWPPSMTTLRFNSPGKLHD